MGVGWGTERKSTTTLGYLLLVVHFSMAERRMFSKKIIDADAFMEMPLSTQALYFHLSMRADDDGFVGNPKKIMRMIGANEDDYKVLSAKRFILMFPNGICVIKHWLIHNYIQKDRYHETQYLDEKKQIEIKENNAYTELDTKCVQDVSRMDTEVRLGKVRLELGKNTSVGKPHAKEQTQTQFPTFWEEYPPRRKQDKQKCLAKFQKLEAEGLGAVIIADIIKRKSEHWDWKKEDGSFVPAPIVYLNNARWESPIVSKPNAEQKTPPNAWKSQDRSQIDTFIKSKTS
jgi:hypothetical protein